MIDDTDMLGFICQDADMGSAAIGHVIKRTDNSQLHGVLEQQRANYQHSLSAASELLQKTGDAPPKAKPLEKAMAYVSSDLQTLTDNSPSKIAELVIRGNTMGITEITKQLHQYDGSNAQITALAKEQIKMEQDNIEALKKFL